MTSHTGPYWEPLARVLFEGDLHVIEDACGYRGNSAWIIDGATQLLEPLNLPAASDPQWLAQQLNVLLAALEPSTAGPRKMLSSVLTAVDEIAQPLIGAEQQRFPSAAISIATLKEQSVEIAALADCTVVVKTANGEVHQIRAELADARVDLAAARASSDAEQRQKLLIRDRELRNTEGNLWVARREPEAAARAQLRVIEHPEQMVMASDGAWRAVDLGIVSGPEEFLERTSSTLAALELLTELRKHQAEIGEEADDACVLALRVSR